MSYEGIHGDVLIELPTLIERGVRASLVNADIPYFKVKDKEWDRQWKDEKAFLAWVGSLCSLLTQVMLPSGSLYLYASPQMARKVGNVVAEHFNILTDIRWRKPAYSTKAEMFRKEDLRAYFPASETIFFCEQYGGEDNERGPDEVLRGQIMKPLKDWFRGRVSLHGIRPRDVNRAIGSSTTGGGMATHYFGSGGLFELPTRAMYERLRRSFPLAFDRDYEDLRKEYAARLTEFERRKRPFFATPAAPYTDVWDFPTVLDYPGKHPCEKPYAMMEHIINASSREGDTVLDLCAGSGVFGEAAVANGRNVIAIERDAHWSRKAADRAARVQGKSVSIPALGVKQRPTPLFPDACETNRAVETERYA